MVDVRMIEGLMEAISPIIKSYVDERITKDVTPLYAQIAAYKAMLPEKGEKGDAGDKGEPGIVDTEIVKSAVLDVVADVLPGEVSVAISKIELPKDGKDGERGEPGIPGEPGKSIELDEIKTAVLSEIALPKDGKDGEPGAPGLPGKSIELEEVIPVLKSLVSEIELPQGKDGEPGKDGQSVDIQDLIPVIVTEVENSVAKIESPKGITADDVRPMLQEMVAAIEVKDGRDGIDGKDADPVEVASLILDDVYKLMPMPEDGKSVTVDDVRPMLQEMVAAIEPAKDGKDGVDGVDGRNADPVEVASLIVDDVAKLIPTPADGKSVTVEDLAPLVDEVVAKKLPNFFMVNEDGMLVMAYANGESRSIGKVRGDPGARGASVMDGSVDEAGTLTFRVSDGRMIQTGNVRGERGSDGHDGKPGERGRDAHEIQILPGIDESKTYIAGVVACWRGGIIRSERQTDPIMDGGDILAAGWSVFLRGIAEEHEADVEDGRFIERTTVYTDGTEFKRRIKTATPIYQGLWKEGVAYLKGDQVTYAGSLFTAQRDTSDKPETTDAFRLSIKRGRDGKDGKIERAPSVVKLDPAKR